MSNLVEDDGGLPDFLQDSEVADDGFDENIEDNTSFPSYSIAFGQSDIVTEGKATPGDMYNRQTEEVLEGPRNLCFFKKEINYRCPEFDGQGTVCYSLTTDVGFVWVSDDLDQEAMDEFGVTQEDIDQRRTGITHDCGSCDFHPNFGWEDGQPPRCNEEAVYYFLDLTDGFDPEPKRLTIRDTNKPASEAIEKFDNEFINNLKRNNLPLYGGVFDIEVQTVTYTNGNNGFQWDIDFNSVVKNEDVFNHAADALDEFKARREDMIQQAKDNAVKDVNEEEEIEHEKDDGPAWPNTN